jgi:hypothetical protein
MSLDRIIPLVVARKSGEPLPRLEEKMAETFVRSLAHYIHPEGVALIISSWMPKPDPNKQAYESRIRSADNSPKDTLAPVEKALKDAGLSLEQAKRAIKEMRGEENPGGKAMETYSNFTHCLRRYTTPEAAMAIVRKLASEPNESPESAEDYAQRYDKWSSPSAYYKPGNSRHYVIKGSCGHALAQCRCKDNGHKTAYKAPIPCPECWSKETGNPDPLL